MPTGNQPQFWLQVRSEYIIDNFDSLLSYLKAYNYRGGEADNPDYITTVNCMGELCRSVSDEVLACPSYVRPELKYGEVTTVRLLCATILARYKAGQTAHREIAVLVNILLKNESCCNVAVYEGLENVIVNCIKGNRLISPAILWDTVMNLGSKFDILNYQVAQMRFETTPGDIAYIIENHGLLVFPPYGLPAVAAMNRTTYDRTDKAKLYTIPGVIDVVVDKKSYKQYADYTKLEEYTQGVLKDMVSVRPSRVVKKSDYAVGDQVVIRVTEVIGVKVVAESIDPAFNTIRGNVFVKTIGGRPDDALVRRSIEVGVYLVGTYVRNDKDKDMFVIGDYLEGFYRDLAAGMANKKFRAVYVRDYSAGKEFVSEDGIYYGVDKSKFAQLGDDDAAYIDECIEMRRPIVLRAYSEAPDVNADRFTAYAEFVTEELGMPIVPDEMFGREEAEMNLIAAYKDACAAEAEEILSAVPNVEYVKADPMLCVPLLTFLHHIVGSTSCLSIERLKYYTVAAMLARILDRDADGAYTSYCRRLLDAEVRFAANTTFDVPILPDELKGVPELVHRQQTIEILRTYKSPDIENTSARAEDMQGRVYALVQASNNLIGILENAELNTIKQFISRALNVEDQFESILDRHTFYGTESISLEFKSSAVFPPTNMRRFASAEADPDLQKWNILKAVCGFLNSRSGGELLIGVRDTGYACGLRDDIEALARLGRIDFASVDRYRTYIQLLIDRAFKIAGRSIASKNITQANVDCLIEENEEGETILRVKINPYLKGIVEFADTDRPEGIDKSYIRLSGRTVPVTPPLADQIRTFKNL